VTWQLSGSLGAGVFADELLSTTPGLATNGQTLVAVRGGGNWHAASTNLMPSP